MSPADITESAAFRAGLARRLAEVGLIPTETAALRLAAPSAPPADPADEDRKAA
jgi:hypothetical protein